LPLKAAGEKVFLTAKSSTCERTGTSKQITIKIEKSDFVVAEKNGLSPTSHRGGRGSPPRGRG
jgi:hypothetical protein